MQCAGYAGCRLASPGDASPSAGRRAGRGAKLTFLRFRWPRAERSAKVGSEIGARLGRLVEAASSAASAARPAPPPRRRARAPRLAGVGEAAREVDADALRTAAAAVARRSRASAERSSGLLDESLPLPLASRRGRRRGHAPRRLRPAAGSRDEPRQRKLDQLIILGQARSTSPSERPARICRADEPRARPRRTRPPNELTPETLGEHARTLAAEHEHLERRGARARARCASSAWARCSPSAGAAATSRA